MIKFSALPYLLLFLISSTLHAEDDGYSISIFKNTDESPYINKTMHWAVLMNKRSEDEKFTGDLDNLTWTLINGIKALN